MDVPDFSSGSGKSKSPFLQIRTSLTLAKFVAAFFAWHIVAIDSKKVMSCELLLWHAASCAVFQAAS